MPLQSTPAVGFAFIDEYRSLAKDLVRENCDEMLTFDQIVPRTRFLSDDLDLKPDVKMEKGEQPADVYGLFMNSNGLNTAADSSISINDNLFYATSVTSNKPDFTGCENITSVSSFQSSPSAVVSSSHSAFSTAVPVPLTLSAPLSGNFLQPKISTYVTELGGSGCTLMSNNTGFQTDNVSSNSSSQLSVDGHEDSLEYIDLDKQPVSFYDESDSFSSQFKSELPSEDSDRLEEMVGLMRDVLQQDRESLKIPYEPNSWTPDDVNRWVSWVCYRYDAQNIAAQFYQYDGHKLCELSKDYLVRVYGHLGECIFNELQLWKAAKDLSIQDSGSAPSSDVSWDQHLQNPYMERPRLSWTPCVSPAPSTCSGSFDGNGNNFSTHSDHSDDDSMFGSQLSTTPASKFSGSSSYNKISGKVPSGRGHKQTIHLWQFLKELLLSNESSNDCIRWLDRKNGIFKIEDSKKVAQLWGMRKNRPAMNYDKLSRSVRQYYKKGIIKKTEQSKRLVYQFCAGYL